MLEELRVRERPFPLSRLTDLTTQLFKNGILVQLEASYGTYRRGCALDPSSNSSCLKRKYQLKIKFTCIRMKLRASFNNLNCFDWYLLLEGFE